MLGWLLIALVAGSGCAAPAPREPTFRDELNSPDGLAVCISPLGAPAASQVDGQLEGYNVEFARGLADRLVLTVNVVETPFVDLLDQVEDGACDLSVSSQNITAGRLERVAFVPYTRSQQRVLVAHGNPRMVETMEDLCGLMVSTTAGSIFGDMIEGSGDFNGTGLSQACIAQGHLPIEVHKFDEAQVAVEALLDGTVTAYLGNSNYVFQYPERLVQSPATVPAARQGIGLALDRPLLRAAIEGALGELIEDGTYRQILFDALGDEELVRRGSIEP